MMRVRVTVRVRARDEECSAEVFIPNDSLECIAASCRSRVPLWLQGRVLRVALLLVHARCM